MRRSDSATLAAMKRRGVPETLENWLLWNFATEDDIDAELLEVLPERFLAEAEWRLEIETRFAEWQRQPR